jgi:hypothetical protein
VLDLLMLFVIYNNERFIVDLRTRCGLAAALPPRLSQPTWTPEPPGAISPPVSRHPRRKVKCAD